MPYIPPSERLKVDELMFVSAGSLNYALHQMIDQYLANSGKHIFQSNPLNLTRMASKPSRMDSTRNFLSYNIKWVRSGALCVIL